MHDDQDHGSRKPDQGGQNPRKPKPGASRRGVERKPAHPSKMGAGRALPPRSNPPAPVADTLSPRGEFVIRAFVEVVQETLSPTQFARISEHWEARIAGRQF